ncbi:type II toxin-antitoxin system RelB/DinJ family antitoxin [Lactobacillus sp. PV034]|uniref:type II toxin-antitoxin system RelB/DinJ family antitoxin n=1 Tax=Lactobacillus sp. PV034 TaxID=2594495 RepID=UPI00223EECD7|nr:type II toxin-antitoxin system RelB/DinJ family antitoxin [Lactobacillus sp. PV034]QNQ80455.1 damage-inducible protein [Lactobacillus sp. PV034]
MKTSETKKVQVNVNKEIAEDAENVMSQIGLTPSAVINSLYREIVATGKIPLSFSLTPEQLATMRIKEAAMNLPTQKVETDKELTEFFDED